MNAVSQAPGFAGLVPTGGVIPELPVLSKDAALLTLARHSADLVGQSALLIHERLRTREALGMLFNFEWTNETLFYGLYARVTSFWDLSPMAATGVPSPEERALLEPVAGDLPEGILEAEAVLPFEGGKRQLDRKTMRAAGDLLAEAGWTVGSDGMRRNAAGEALRVEILNDSQTFDKVMNPYVENMRALGIDARNSRVDDVQYEARRRNFDFDLITSHLGQDAITGADLEQYFGSGSVKDVFNAMGLANPAIDALGEWRERNAIRDKTHPLLHRERDRHLALHFARSNKGYIARAECYNCDAFAKGNCASSSGRASGAPGNLTTSRCDTNRCHSRNIWLRIGERNPDIGAAMPVPAG